MALRYVVQIYRFLSLFTSFGLVCLGLSGSYLFFAHGGLHDARGHPYVSLSECVLGMYLTVLAGLLFLFHAGRPKFVFKYFQFLLYFVGRGLTEVCIGLTTLLFCYPQHLLGVVLGALAVLTGLMSLMLAFPCVNLSEDEYLSQTGEERGWSISSEKQPLLAGQAPRAHASSQDIRDLSEPLQPVAKEHFPTTHGEEESFPGEAELRDSTTNNPFESYQSK
jgi:hypothetical protein